MEEVSLLSCPVCLKPHFQGVDALRSSLISVATTHISCPVCNELFLGLDKLTIHLFSHISNNRVVQESRSQAKEVEVDKMVIENCLNQVAVPNVDVIDESEIDSPSMEKKAVEVETQKRIICDICNFHFSDETILDLHQKLLHQTSPDKKTGKYNYHCHLCSKQFRLRGSLMVHMRVAHFGIIQNSNKNISNRNIKSVCTDNNTDDQDPTPIAFCEKPQEEFNIKQQVVTDRTQIFIVPAEISPVQLEKKKILNGSSKGPDNKQWECEVCFKLFTTKYFLKKHKRLHTGEMPYYCAQCNKYFTFQQSYHKHMLYHSDDKPHICSECGRAFKELSTLHNHERIHSGERPFSCETCGKCFRQRVSYLVHRRIHTGVMPYKCTACNKSFRYKVSQRSHKCPVSPPGCVVRTPDLVAKLIQNQKIAPEQTSSPTQIFCTTEDLQPTVLNANVKHGDNAEENLGFLEQRFQVNTQNQPNSNGIQDYLPESEGVNEKQIDLNENVQATFGDKSAIRISSGTFKHGQQEDIEKYTNFMSANVENIDSSPNVFTPNDSSSPDFFALILSPVLSDVQSLCLSNYTNAESNTKKENSNATQNEDVLQTINEESFKELLYGHTPK